MYPTVTHPLADNTADEIMAFADNFLQVMFRRNISGKAKSKGSGFPWCKLGATNGELFTNQEVIVKDAFKTRLYAMLNMVPCELDAAELVDSNLTDPCRMFIKNELHARKKCEEGRYRLIFNVSVIDIMIETFLFEHLFNENINNWIDQPSKPGIGFDDNGICGILECVKTFSRPCSSDVRGMDWSMKGIDFDRMLYVWSRNSGVKINTPLYYAMSWRLKALSLSMVINSDGLVIQQVIPGIMKSGSKATSQGDSITVVAWGLEIGVRSKHNLIPIAGETEYTARIPSPIFAMGDDAIQEWVDDAVEKYLRIGVVVTDYGEIDIRRFEYCGHLMGTETPVELVRWNKSLAEHLYKKYRNLEQKMESFAGIKYELRNQPKVLEIINNLFVEIDWLCDEETADGGGPSL